MIRERRATECNVLVWIMIVGLVLSGLSAYPLEWELNILVRLCDNFALQEPFASWIRQVQEGIITTNRAYPFLAYGTDWLAFAHLVIAVAFWGVLRAPIQNIWIIEWALFTSAAVIPHALIAGHIREIPLFHQLIDCMFGIISLPILLRIRHLIKTRNNLNP